MGKTNQKKIDKDLSPMKQRGIFVTLIFAIFVTAMATMAYAVITPTYTGLTL